MTEGVKISYSAANVRVRCELSRLACLGSEVPPNDLIAKAKTKLESVKAQGEIAFYQLFETRLLETWKALRESGPEIDDVKIHITIGGGSPNLPGIKVEAAPTDKSVASLSVDTSAQAQNWRWEWFKLFVTKKLRDLGIKDAINTAQLFSCFLRVKAGEKVQSVPLGTAFQASGQGGAGKTYSVVANKQRMEIGVVIRNVKELRSKVNREAMLNLIGQAVRQMSIDGVQYQIIKKDFFAALQSALEGPEGLGLELPLVLLAAMGQPKVARPTNYAGAGRISFQVSKDKMEAVIQGFDQAYYRDPSAPVTLEWVQNELLRSLISLPMSDEVTKTLSEAIARKETLNGLVACHGLRGVAGKGPYLHPSYRDAATRVQGNIEKDSLDMREMQQRQTVQRGQLVAEIRYTTPPVVGKNIFGDEVPGGAGENLLVKVGDGIQQRENGRYFATSDGIPLVEEAAISLSKALVIEGDVNLRTGNVRFDGPVEIKGSVEHGSVVETTGDLVIHGSIRGGRVRTQGKLSVKAGITTGPEGQVAARGDIQAEFIENSNVLCGGNLLVTKALIGSQVFTGGAIEIDDETGVVAGGRIFCRASVSTGSLGFKRGALTEMQVGVNWRAARSVDIKKRRLEKLQKRSQDDRAALRELVQKSKAQTTARHQEMKEQLQERLTRLRTITESLEAQMAKAVLKITYDRDAWIKVRAQLFANVSLTVGGQIVPILNDVAGVGVLAKKRRGNYVIPVEDLEAEQKRAG